MVLRFVQQVLGIRQLRLRAGPYSSHADGRGSPL